MPGAVLSTQSCCLLPLSFKQNSGRADRLEASAQWLARFFQGQDFVPRACNDLTLLALFLVSKNSNFPKLSGDPQGSETDPVASSQPTPLPEPCLMASDIKAPPTPCLQPGAQHLSVLISQGGNGMGRQPVPKGWALSEERPLLRPLYTVGLLSGSGKPSDPLQSSVRKGC